MARKSVWTHPTLKSEYEGQYSNVTLNDGTIKRQFLIVKPSKGKDKVMYAGSVQGAKKAGWVKKV